MLIMAAFYMRGSYLNVDFYQRPAHASVLLRPGKNIFCYIFNISSFLPLMAESILSELAGEVPAPMALSCSFVGVGDVLPVPNGLLGADAEPLEASDWRFLIPWIVSRSAVCRKETEDTDDGSQGINT